MSSTLHIGPGADEKKKLSVAKIENNYDDES